MDIVLSKIGVKCAYLRFLMYKLYLSYDLLSNIHKNEFSKNICELQLRNDIFIEMDCNTLGVFLHF